VRRERPIERPESGLDIEAMEKSAQKLPLDETKIIIVDGYRKRVPLHSTRSASQNASKIGSVLGSARGGSAGLDLTHNER
jgi:hypothetical protein